MQKAALRALVTVLAEALAPEGIHVATATVRGLVRDDGPIRPDEIAAL